MKLTIILVIPALATAGQFCFKRPHNQSRFYPFSKVIFGFIAELQGSQLSVQVGTNV